MEYGVWSMEYGVKSKQTETLNFPDSYRDRTPNSELETRNSKLRTPNSLLILIQIYQVVEFAV